MLLAPALSLLVTLPAADQDLPVQSITAFKDGHALVVREGTRPVTDGFIALDGLPNPLLGTFWPYATDAGNDVVSATAAMISRTSERMISSNTELLAKNIGKFVELTFQEGVENTKFSGRIEGVSTGSTNLQVVLLSNGNAVTSIPANLIRRVSLVDGGEIKAETESRVAGLKLRLKDTSAEQAGVGLMYVQKGFRWIPQYRVTLGPDGKASYILRATLVNDIIDLDNATVNLVVGVPMFAFAGQTDPIALGTNVAQALGRVNIPGNALSNFSNGVQLQGQIASDYGGSIAVEPEAPEVTGAKRNEDLFVFQVDHVTLAKGERMSIEVSRGTFDYEHHFQVDLPVVPPAELGNVNQQQLDQVAKLLRRPKVEHQLMIKNPNREPLTTAPTLLFTQSEDGHETLLAQSLQTYTAPGGSSRIDLGTAIEINVQFEEEEIGREVENRKHGGRMFDRVNLRGTITVCNHRPVNSKLVIRRYVPGPLDSASDDGSMKTLAPFDQDATSAGLSGTNISGSWWYGYRPNWYSALNPMSRAEWTIDLAPEEIKEPTYEWHYFWRW